MATGTSNGNGIPSWQPCLSKSISYQAKMNLEAEVVGRVELHDFTGSLQRDAAGAVVEEIRHV